MVYFGALAEGGYVDGVVAIFQCDGGYVVAIYVEVLCGVFSK